MELKNRDQWGDKEYGLLESLKLRYFTPREIACLLCFPPCYGKCLNVNLFDFFATGGIHVSQTHV